MLPLQVAFTLLTLIVASCLALMRGSATIVSFHIIFAIGVVPLILGAIIHFVPVLTRTRNPNIGMRLLPYIALLGGMLVTSYFAIPQALPHGHILGALIITITIAYLALWTYRLKIKTIGNPHPCLNWYLAAIMCLLIGLCAILAAYFNPAQHTALRLLHLHINTLGFISITALGTLQVLMPTVVQRPDFNAASRLIQHLKWIVAGTIITSFSAAWQPALSWMGLPLLAVPILHTFKSWTSLYARDIFKLHGAAPALMAALCGYVIALVIGAMHAYSHAHFNPVAAFIIAFLMPLVTGAVSYLLPTWIYSGEQTLWHLSARKYLGFGSGLRALALITGGVLAGLNYVAGWYFAAFAMGTFIIQALACLNLRSKEIKLLSN